MGSIVLPSMPCSQLFFSLFWLVVQLLHHRQVLAVGWMMKERKDYQGTPGVMTVTGVGAFHLVFLAALRSCTTPGVFLLQSDSSRDVSKTAQCRQSGVQNCRAVTVNMEYLEQSLNPGDSINLIQGLDLSLKLRRAPTGSHTSTLSCSFSLSDGGEATLTMRPSTGAVFASIKPVTGSALYTVEPCGQGCNLLYKRDNQFFNKFQD